MDVVGGEARPQPLALARPVKITVSKGVRFPRGSPIEATLNAQSGANRSAPAKAAKAPAKAAQTSTATAEAAETAIKR